jgi:LmbE family N-acetylglucosaminyl deacetylase
MCFAANQKVLLVISHQDDESLFCGGLLSALCGRSEVTVICMSQAKQAGGIQIRDEQFRNACAMAQARAVTTSFREARHVWSHVDRFFRQRPEQIVAMTEFLQAQADAIQPDVVITHNERGEYGHCYHKVVHRVCRRVFPSDKLYFIGIRSQATHRRRFVVNYDAAKKKQLLDCYPDFNATRFCKRFFGAAIAYQPETYLASGKQEPAPTAKGRLGIACDLTADFLHFHSRKLLSNLGLC